MNAEELMTSLLAERIPRQMPIKKPSLTTNLLMLAGYGLSFMGTLCLTIACKDVEWAVRVCDKHGNCFLIQGKHYKLDEQEPQEPQEERDVTPTSRSTDNRSS